MRLCQIEAYISLFDSFIGIFWKCARIGERLSPYVSICCVIMAVSQDLVHIDYGQEANRILFKISIFIGD